MKGHELPDRRSWLLPLGSGLLVWGPASLVAGALLGRKLAALNGLVTNEVALVLGLYLALPLVAFGIPIAVLVGHALLMLSQRRGFQALGTLASLVAFQAGLFASLSSVACDRCATQGRASLTVLFVIGVVAFAVVGFAARFVALRWPRSRPWRLASLLVFAALLAVAFASSSATPALPAQRGPSVSAQASGSGRRVLLVGFDGLDPVLLNRLMERGDLPTFRALTSEGFYASAKTLSPTLSPAIWTTVVTGKLPLDHGILGFFGYGLPGVRGSLQRLSAPGCGAELLGRAFKWAEARQLVWKTPVTSRMRKAKALWSILSERKRRVVVVNWWASWPAEPVNGVIVTDRFQHAALRREGPGERGLTHPERLFEELRPLAVSPASLEAADIRTLFEPGPRHEASGVRTDETFPETWSTQREDLALAFLAADRSTARIADRLLKQEPWEFAAVYFRGVDVFSHLMGEYSLLHEGRRVDPEKQRRYGRALEAYYHIADGQLRELLSLAGADTDVILCSDHGFRWESPERFDHVASAPPGVLVLHGPDARRGLTGVVSIQDVAPTALYLLGEPIAQDMAGRVLDEAIAPETAAQLPRLLVATFEGPAGAGEDAGAGRLDPESLEELKSLGYVK